VPDERSVENNMKAVLLIHQAGQNQTIVRGKILQNRSDTVELWRFKV